jgi:glycosidase
VSTTRLLDSKRQHPALQQLSTRRQIPTNADDDAYAFLRTAADRSERVLVVMNFQNAPTMVTLDPQARRRSRGGEIFRTEVVSGLAGPRKSA